MKFGNARQPQRREKEGGEEKGRKNNEIISGVIYRRVTAILSHFSRALSSFRLRLRGVTVKKSNGTTNAIANTGVALPLARGFAASPP